MTTSKEVIDYQIYDRILEFYWNSEKDAQETTELRANSLVDGLTLLILKKLVLTEAGINILSSLTNQGALRDFLAGKPTPEDKGIHSQINHFKLELLKFGSRITKEDRLK